MRSATLLCLLVALPAPARAGHWEWTRRPVSAYDRSEIRRVAPLASLTKCALDAEAERGRDVFNRQALMRYNGMIPPPMTGPTGPCGDH